MASTTPNIGLTLPTGAEKVSRQIINTNNTIIDSKIGAVPSGKNLQGEVDALNSNISAFASTVYDNWSRMTGHESGTTLTKNSWTSIAYQSLPAGTYYVSCCVNMGTTQTSATLFHRILIGSGTNVAIQDAINVKSRTLPLATIIKLSEAKTIYLQAYTSDDYTTVNAHICIATKLF